MKRNTFYLLFLGFLLLSVNIAQSATTTTVEKVFEETSQQPTAFATVIVGDNETKNPMDGKSVLVTQIEFP